MAFITAEQFEREYAERSGVPIEWLHNEGLFVFPCHCSDSSCQGWQMTRASSLEDYQIEQFPPEYILKAKLCRVIEAIRKEIGQDILSQFQELGDATAWYAIK